MIGEATETKNRKKPLAAAVRILGTLLLILVVAVCIPLTMPRFFGYQIYSVISGSMEPEMPVGSLIYVHEEKPEDIEEQDIIAFYSSLEESGIITHRVVKNNIVSGTFITKGDANDKEDPVPIPYDNFIGRVIKTVPYVGKVLTCMTSMYGKIAAASIVVLGVVLNLAGSRQIKEDE